MEQAAINHWAVLTAAVSDFAVGALWYSPLLFFRAWMRENDFTEEQLKESARGPAVTYGVTFILALIISYNLAFFLADPATDAMWGLQAGLLAGFGFAATAFCIVALFEQRSFRYMLINCGYIVVAFALKGLIIGVWR